MAASMLIDYDQQSITATLMPTVTGGKFHG